MNIQELEKIMVEHGVVIRAITPYHISVYEVMYKDKFPDAEEYYDERFKRNMIRAKTEHQTAGKFIIETVKTMSSTVYSINPFFTILLKKQYSH